MSIEEVRKVYLAERVSQLSRALGELLVDEECDRDDLVFKEAQGACSKARRAVISGDLDSAARCCSYADACLALGDKEIKSAADLKTAISKFLASAQSSNTIP